MVGSIIVYNLSGNSSSVFAAIIHITDEGETKKFVSRTEMR
jgi:hypothetical protein